MKFELAPDKMKTSKFNFIFNLILLISILIIILTIASCKSSSGTPNYPVTEEDAAEIISNTVLRQFGGLLTHVTEGIQLEQRSACGLTKDTVLSWTSQAGSVSAKTNLQWHYQLACSDKTLTGTYTGSINYNGPHFTADNTCTGTLTCAPQANTAYQISLTLNISGTDAKKAVDANTLKTNIDLQTTNMLVDKASGLVTSGQMKVNIQISYYNYSGTFKFLGNHMATIVLNSGTVYNLNL
ncbi:hypothetical protein ACFGVR_23675 [Mucilaginibacter sp. AW1-3]